MNQRVESAVKSYHGAMEKLKCELKILDLVRTERDRWLTNVAEAERRFEAASKAAHAAMEAMAFAAEEESPD